mmetsp:Transcript_26178/g.44140  ORF Transcript_26178/g.44140 Transcript_26178/m.44140 type:complete len:150 (-) Transcript_26178:242-691(-)
MSNLKQPLTPGNKKRFVSPLFGCCSYRDPENKCKWCPYFIPMSVCGTCMVVGRVVSKIEKEKEVFCEMGPKGLCCCFFSNVVLGPPGYACFGYCIREQVKEKFNVEDEGPCLLNTICYPCSFFQMFVSVAEWKAENEKTASTGTEKNSV